MITSYEQSLMRLSFIFLLLFLTPFPSQSFLHNHIHTHTHTHTFRTHLPMSLLHIPPPLLSPLLPLTPPSGAQYSRSLLPQPSSPTGSGSSTSPIFETVSVTFLGLWTSYFVSFVLGAPVAIGLGTCAAFYGLIGPNLKALSKNWEMRQDLDVKGDGNGMLGGWLFVGRVVYLDEEEDENENEEDDYDDYDDDHDYDDDDDRRTRIRVKDESGRVLQLHFEGWRPEYVRVKRGMSVVCLVLGVPKRTVPKKGRGRAPPSMERMVRNSEFFVPAADVYVGDYPFLNHEVLREIMEESGIEEECLRLDEEGEFL